MAGAAVTERDLGILRSFARRIDPSDAGAHNNLGVLYYRRGLPQEAVLSFTRALDLDSKMTVAQRNLEIVHRATGYYDRRITELRERLRHRPDERDARWELARGYAAIGQLDEAVHEFAALLADDSRDLGALIQLGLMEQRRGNLEAALEWFSRALEQDPQSSVVELRRGEVLYNRGMNREALGALERAVELNPDNAEAHHLLAFVLGDLGRHADARLASRRAVELNPALGRAQSNLSLDQAPGPRSVAPSALEGAAAGASTLEHLAHYNLGRAFRQKGYYAEALREYRLALERGEDRLLVRQAMAEVHLVKRDLSAALALYDELAVEAPQIARVWNERGVCLHQLGRREEALASYRRAIEAQSDHPLAHNNMGVVLAALGHMDEAVDAFRDALRRKADLLEARLNLALLLAQLRRFQLALEAYRQALDVTPGSSVAWNGIGLVLVELKRFADARNAFARAVEADPDSAAAHYNLSFTLSNLGDFEGALRAVRRALELDPYYVAQKFLLAIELQYEDASLTVVPDISGEQPFGEGGETFVFDQRLLDQLFTELKPAAAPAERHRVGDDPFALARDYLTKALLEHAIAEVSRAMQRGADRAEGAALLGEIYARRGLHGEALERFREATQAAPGHRAAREGELRALLALNRAAEARPLAETLLAADGGEVDVALLAARARSETGDPAGAIEVLRRAEQRAPARADVRKLLGDVALKVGDVEVARAAYRAALDLDPGYAEVWLAYGRLCEQRGSAGDAEEAYRAALEHLPSFAEAAHALAALLNAEGRGADAMGLLIATLEHDPYDFEALVLLARVLLDANRPADAFAACGRVVRFQPEHVAARYFLGVALARDRRYREAVQQWEQCIALDPSGPHAAKARSHARTALDLVHIFAGAAA